jgi:hypothetical protein
MNMAPASVVGVVYLGVAGTDVVGLVIGPDRCHGGSVGSDLHPRCASITGFLGATPKPAQARTRPRTRCGHLWLST